MEYSIPAELSSQVKKGTQRRDFFTIPEYEQWSEETPGSDKWEVKYYKVCPLIRVIVMD